MVFFAFVMAVKGVRPPHRIFQTEEAPIEDVVVEDPDHEEEEEEEDEDEKRKRFEQRGGIDITTSNFSGTGIDFTAREKQLLLHIYDKCTEFWKMSNCEVKVDGRQNQRKRYYQWRPKDIRGFVTQITGVGGSTLTGLKDRKDKDDEVNGPTGWVMPSNRTDSTREGVNPNALEAVLPEMDEFIRDEIKKARKGGHLTVKMLAAKATEYFKPGPVIKPKRMKRVLNRLGYEYGDRKGVFVNRRHDKENLLNLKAFCEFVFANVDRNPTTGRYYFTIPIAFGDGANEYTKAFRARSWMLRGHPELGTCEKSRKKDTGQRVNMLGAIYSNSFDMNSFTAWNSEEEGKNSYAKSEDIVDHTRKHVLPNLPPGTGGVYVLDNASNNKKIEEQLKYATSDEVHDWINEHDPDPERFQTYWEEGPGADASETTTKKALMKYIRINIDEFTELALLLREKDVKIRYLPKYYPECNPIEIVWAHIKRAYKATDSSLPWRQRLDLAHAEITEEQIEKCFDHSIRYCLDRLVEFRNTEDVHGGAMVIGDDDDDEDWMNEDDDQ